MKDEILRLLAWEDFDPRASTLNARKWPPSRTREPQREERVGEEVMSALSALLTPPKPKKTAADVLRELLSPAVASQPAAPMAPAARVPPSCEYCGRVGHLKERCFALHPDLRPK